MRFVAFDLETTGFFPGVDSIVEIGAVRFIDAQVESVFVTLVDPKRSIPRAASAVNGITDDMVAGKPLIEDLLQPFAEFCGDDFLVAHNAGFDVQFLTSEITRLEAVAPRGNIFDTCSLSRKIFPGLANYKLGTLVQHLKIPSSGFHRAEEDATYCGYLFCKMVERLTPVESMFSMTQLLNLSGKTVLNFPQIIPQPKQLSLL